MFASIATRVVLPPEAMLRLLHEGAHSSRGEIRFRGPPLEKGETLFQVFAREKPDSSSLFEEDQLATFPETEFLPDRGRQGDLSFRGNSRYFDHGS